MDLGGAFQAHAPLFGEMWACPNRKMNMHVECAPPPFGLEVGVVLSKIWNRESCGQKMDEKVCFVYDLDWKC